MFAVVGVFVRLSVGTESAAVVKQAGPLASVVDSTNVGENARHYYGNSIERFVAQLPLGALGVQGLHLLKP